jgi:TPR repeat protein
MKKSLLIVIAFLILSIFSTSCTKSPKELIDEGISYENKHKYEEAFKCFQKASKSGNAEALYFLSSCYSQGHGVKRNDSIAFNLEKLSAQGGCAYAQLSMGCYYENGITVPKDNERAIFWYKKAAEQGLKEAQERLSYIYKYGEGMEHDEYESDYWKNEAQENQYMEE